MSVMNCIRGRTFSGQPDSRRALQLLREIADTPANPTAQRLDRPVALYGGGDLGCLARDYLRHIGVGIACIVDRQAARLESSGQWSGIPVIYPDAVPSQYFREMLLAVCIANAPYVPLRDELAAQGWRNIIPFYDMTELYRHLHPLANGWIAPPLEQQDIEELSKILTAWDDNLSRAHHLQFLAWRRLREEWTFAEAPVTTQNRYFIPEVMRSVNVNDHFVDVGAYDGRVSLRFCHLTGGRCRSICAIEPDHNAFSVLARSLCEFCKQNDVSLRLVPKAVGESDTIEAFACGFGYASKLWADGRSTVSVTTIDNLHLDATFIKLHLEGNELSALRGATQTLRRCQPIIAVTVYHNSQGMWETPVWLMENLPNYRFMFRLHSWLGTGAVVYGIPASSS